MTKPAAPAAGDGYSDSRQRYRLVTRSDFDGLVCAVLLRKLDLIGGITFVHPKDMQDGRIPIDDKDITTNLPYVPGAALVFDHHHSETIRTGGAQRNHIIDPEADSAARVLYDYYGGRAAFPDVSQSLMDAVDQADSARYTLSEVLQPLGWTLLNFLMDARTGLGRFRDFRISNYALMMDLIEACATKDADEILELPDVRERVDVYLEQEPAFCEQLQRCGTMRGDVVVLDLRDEEVIYAGNRFMIYALFPDATVSVHVLWGRQKQNTVLAVGKSIFNRTSPTNLGELLLQYGGGGHANAGTCQVDHHEADGVLDALVTRINADARQQVVTP